MLSEYVTKLYGVLGSFYRVLLGFITFINDKQSLAR